MGNREPIRIRLITVFLILTILIIFVMGGFIYRVVKEKIKADKKINQLNKNISNLENLINSTLLSNTIKNNSADDTNKETKLDINDNIAQQLLNKINFPTYAVSSIYNVKNFNSTNIPNDLILRLGWSKINHNNKTITNNNEIIQQTATKQTLHNSIENIFGKINFTDTSFNNTNIKTFSGYHENIGEINYSNNLYTANYVESGGGDVPFIYQQLEKILKYNNKIDIYVKTAFVNTEYNENTDDCKYLIYSDFNNDTFKTKLLETTSKEFSNNQNLEQISTKENKTLSNILNKLDTYVYSFELDTSTSNYYLISFYKFK